MHDAQAISSPHVTRKLKALSWNVNGLRAVLRRKFGNINKLLSELDADIICFQETKLTKGDFDRTLAILEGWDSYFSINRGGSAYSGTATFVRDGIAPVLSAQEGVTGILHKEGYDQCPDLFETGPQIAAASIWKQHSREELELIDNEGRCVVTDHGAFILFNVYGPAISSEENAERRFAFKLEFYKALSIRMEALRARGRRVILLGDLNIAPAPIDQCEAGPKFSERADRVWLNKNLRNGGIDVFRQFHPTRVEAYTCWSQASGARINNWGARIDLILAFEETTQANLGVGELRDIFMNSNIWPQLQGSDHCPVWADIILPEDLKTQNVQVPSFSTKCLFPGKQNKITGWLQRKPLNTELQNNSVDELPQSRSSPAKIPSVGQQNKFSRQASGQSPVTKAKTQKPGLQVRGGQTKKSGKSKGPIQSSLKAFIAKPKSDDTNQQSSAEAKSNLLEPENQKTLRANPSNEFENSIFEGPESCEESKLGRSQISAPHQLGSIAWQKRGLHIEEPPDPDVLILESQREAELQQEEELQEFNESYLDRSGSLPRLGVPNSNAVEAWNKIKDRMKPPKCKGHNEDCVIRQVKKKGKNHGKLFYVCHRADGPPPTGRCDFFLWAKN